ncbi:MAG TPA: hypothetical protein PLD49_08020 [Thermoclostridium caenicola]|nr:hypothetical protein [Thermoclostridium caenicola]
MMVCGIVVSLRFIEHQKLDKAGLVFRVKDMIGVLSTAAFYAVVMGMESLIQGNLFPRFISQIANGYERSLINVLLIPISEEMLCRGYILGNCFESLKRWHDLGFGTTQNEPFLYLAKVI